MKIINIYTRFTKICFFGNLNNNSLPFEKYASPLIKQLDNTSLEKIRPVATLDFGNISTNWKFLIENFIEPYHVQFVHKNTTSQPLKDHYTIVDGNSYGSGVDLKEEDSSSGSLSVSSKYLSFCNELLYQIIVTDPDDTDFSFGLDNYTDPLSQPSS